MEKQKINPNSITKINYTKANFPEQSAQSLFHCMRKFDYLLSILKNKSISPRYFKENIKYLGIGLDEIAYPMLCFCDIPFHKLTYHTKWYGKYAIAFSKTWGINKGLQPITYLNENSELLKTFQEAFNKSQNEDLSAFDSSGYKATRNNLLAGMKFFKPMKGESTDIEGTVRERWMTDDCEWRYIGTFKNDEAEEAIITPERLTDIALRTLNNAIESIANSANISFEYSDIQYIIISSSNDFDKLVEFVEKLPFFHEQPKEKALLYSKVLVWDNIQGDF